MARWLPWIYGLVLLGETVGLSVLYAVSPPKASDPLSVWLATLGTASMIVMLGYSVARRSQRLRNIARLSTWLHLHIFLGIQGVIFVFFHSVPMFLRLPSVYLLNPGVLNLLACATAFFSGLFGRYLFAQVPRTLGGQHMAAKEVEAELAALDDVDDLPDTVTTLWKQSPKAVSFLGLIRADLARRGAIRTLRGSELSAELRATAERRLQLARAMAVLTVSQRWFRAWILLHRPIAAAMYVLTFVHVALAFMFSPTMRFF